MGIRTGLSGRDDKVTTSIRLYRVTEAINILAEHTEVKTGGYNGWTIYDVDSFVAECIKYRSKIGITLTLAEIAAKMKRKEHAFGPTVQVTPTKVSSSGL